MKGTSRRRSRTALVVAAMMTASLLALCAHTEPAIAASSNESLTAIQVDTEWPNLDPRVDTQQTADNNLMNAIYGQLFEQTPSAGCPGGCKNPGKIVPDLAKGFKISPDGLTVTIELRKGMTFQDGTPFNARAVRYNIERDLSKSSICRCKVNFAVVKSVTTKGSHEVQLHLSQPYAPLMSSFIDAGTNWIISPTALKKMGENKFEQHPVGAGPFEVVKNTPSTELDLKKFPNYWEKGHPLLDTLKFVNIANDSSAFGALKAGSAQVVVGMQTPELITEAQQSFQVPIIPAVVVNTVEFNTTVAPFNNKLAREAVAYATDPGAIVEKLLPKLGTTVEAPVGPGNQYYEKKVPGYRTYNLDKAKALVKRLGGLSFTYMTVTDPFNNEVAEALQAEWQQAGMQVKIDPILLTAEVADFQSNSWQAVSGAAGGSDPDAGVQSIPTRFRSNGTFTCCKDAELDPLIDKSTRTDNPAARRRAFDKVYRYIATNALAVDVYAESLALVAAKGVTGLTGTTAGAAHAVAVPWENLGFG